MNKKFNIKEYFTNSKKLKYGSTAIVFTVVFVIFILLINVVISYINHVTGGTLFYEDMTTNRIYSVSDKSHDALKGVNQQIEIIFACPKDKVESNDTLNTVKILCENYASTHSNITISYHDILSEVAYFNKFKKSSADTPTQASLIIYCPSTNLSKMFNLVETADGKLSDMYKYTETAQGYSRFAFDGENKITNAILYVSGNSGNTLKAAFTTGHNEDINDSLKVYLEDLGYTVSTVDLKKTSSTELSQYDLVIVCEPLNDFSGRSEFSDKNMSVTNEIELLRSYVIDNMGNLIVLTGSTAVPLPELFALMEESFGVKIDNTSLVAEGGANSLGDNGSLLRGTYTGESADLGYSIHKSISTAANAPSPAFYLSSGLEIVDKEGDYIDVYPVIVTSSDAVIYNTASSEAVSWQNKPLMTISRNTRLIGEKEQSSHVLVVSTSAFLYFLEEPSFSNSEILVNALTKMNGSELNTVIDFKLLDQTGLVVTADEAKSLTIKLSVVFPVIIIIIGAVVFIKRKYL